MTSSPQEQPEPRSPSDLERVGHTEVLKGLGGDAPAGHPEEVQEVLGMLRGLARAALSGVLGQDRSLMRTSDVMTEAYLRARKAMAEARSKADFARQFKVIAKRFVIDELRARGTLKRGEGPSVELNPEVPGGIGIDWARLEAWELLERCERVEPSYAQVLIGHYLQGQTCEALAPEMEISPAAVQRRLLSARAFLWTLDRDENRG